MISPVHGSKRPMGQVPFMYGNRTMELISNFETSQDSENDGASIRVQNIVCTNEYEQKQAKNLCIGA